MSISITKQMEDILREVENVTDDAIESAISTVPKSTASTLRDTSPKKTGDYRKGWRVKKLDRKAAVVYNATAPGLTHLLEKGHLIRNKKGDFGRAPAHPHIKPAEEEGAVNFFNEISNRLEEKL